MSREIGEISGKTEGEKENMERVRDMIKNLHNSQGYRDCVVELAENPGHDDPGFEKAAEELGETDLYQSVRKDAIIYMIARHWDLQHAKTYMNDWNLRDKEEEIVSSAQKQIMEYQSHADFEKQAKDLPKLWAELADYKGRK